MRQKLIKVILIVILSVSVFFSFNLVAFADDSIAEDWDGYFEFDSSPVMMVEFVASNNLNNSTAYTGKWSGSTTARLTIRGLQQGYSYTGFGYIDVPYERMYYDQTALYSTANIFCTDVLTPDGISISFFQIHSSDASLSQTLRIYFYFNNYYHVPKENYAIVSFVTNIEQGVTTTSGGSIQAYYFRSAPDDYDWAGTITFQPLNADPNISDVYYMGEQQMQQQQQIADQQAQQSAQQHDNLVNGYDNAANDSMLADKNSVLQGFEQQQHDAINSGQQYVADFSAQYDTAIFSSIAPSFALVSTMFNTLWNGMGQFSTVLIIGLVLCVAGYILKLKH